MWRLSKQCPSQHLKTEAPLINGWIKDDYDQVNILPRFCIRPVLVNGKAKSVLTQRVPRRSHS